MSHFRIQKPGFAFNLPTKFGYRAYNKRIDADQFPGKTSSVLLTLKSVKVAPFKNKELPGINKARCKHVSCLVCQWIELSFQQKGFSVSCRV